MNNIKLLMSKENSMSSIIGINSPFIRKCEYILSILYHKWNTYPYWATLVGIIKKIITGSVNITYYYNYVNKKQKNLNQTFGSI